MKSFTTKTLLCVLLLVALPTNICHAEEDVSEVTYQFEIIEGNSWSDPRCANIEGWEGLRIVRMHFIYWYLAEMEYAEIYLGEDSIWNEVGRQVYTSGYYAGCQYWEFVSSAIWPDDNFAVIFRGLLNYDGDPGYLAGGGTNEWAYGVSMVDIDCDSLGLSSAPNRYPLRNQDEDAAEGWGNLSQSEAPAGMLLQPHEWADLPVTFRCRSNDELLIIEPGFYGEYGTDYVLAKKNADGSYTELELKTCSEIPSRQVVYEDVLTIGDRDLTFAIKACNTMDYKVSGSVIVCLNGGSPQDGYYDGWGETWDEVNVDIAASVDKDTNRDDLVVLGQDIDSFGADTGTASFQFEREGPQFVLPISNSLWRPLLVHEYVSQGAFTKTKNRYWNPNQIPTESYHGIWQAYSLHTRASIIFEGEVQELGEQEVKPIKRVAVVRPRGNVVTFDFPAKEGGGFESYGLPMDVNERRTYVLWDVSEGSGDPTFELRFDSGIIHVFGGPEGLIQKVKHIDGREVAVTGSVGWSNLDATATGSKTSARYNLQWAWSGDQLTSLTYTDRCGGEQISVTVGYEEFGDEDDCYKIVELEKQCQGIVGINKYNVAYDGSEIRIGDQRKISGGGGGIRSPSAIR